MVSGLSSKVKGMPVAAKASVALMLASFFEKGIVILAVPFFTRVMSAQAYGEYSVFEAWIEVVGLVSSLCLSKGVFNNGLMDFKEDRSSLSFSLLVLSTISTIGVMAILLGVVSIAPEAVGFPLPLLGLMFAFLLVEPAYNFWRVRQRFEYKYKAQVLVACGASIAAVGAAAVLTFSHQDSATLARAFGYYVALIAVYGVFYAYLAVKSRFSVKVSYWKYALSFNLPLIPHYLSLYFLGHFDRILIAGYLGDEAAGLYTLAYQLGSIATVVWAAINASLIPYTYEKCREGQFGDLNATTVALLAANAVLCFCIALLAPEIMGILAPSSYAGSVVLVPPIIAGVFCSSLYFIFSNVIYFYKKPKYVMVASCISAVVNVALNVLLLERFGVAVAAYATIVSFLIQAVIDFLAMRKVAGQSVYNMGAVFGLTFFLLVAAFVVPLLYGLPIVRWIVAGGIVIAGGLGHKQIIGFLGRLKEER